MRFFVQNIVIIAVQAWGMHGYSQTPSRAAGKINSNVLTAQEFDNLLVSEAILQCKNVKKKNIKIAAYNAHRLLKVEKQEAIPDLMYGMTLSAACSESGFNEKATGDRKFSKKRRPLAIGILQLWPWVKRYNVKRMNLESSAHFWLKHIKRQRTKIKRRCKPRTILKSWKQAWVTAIRFPKKGGRCRESPKHWKLFLRLQKFKKITYKRI